MSTVTPTLIPQQPAFPLLLPDVPKPHPTPASPNSDQPPGHLNARRNIRHEYDDLSDEEDEVEGQWKDTIQLRGYNSLHVIGRLLTRQEEKNDQAESESEDTGSGHSADQMSNANDGENGSEQDLDATMDDLDEADRRNEQYESDPDEDIEDNEEEQEL